MKTKIDELMRLAGALPMATLGSQEDYLAAFYELREALEAALGQPQAVPASNDVKPGLVSTSSLDPGSPDRYVWEEHQLWADGWGWHERENDTDPRTPENKQYYPNTDFNDPDHVRNFRALYTAPPAQTPPRLTDEQLSQVMEQVDFTYAPTKFARAIETAVRKQFGVQE